LIKWRVNHACIYVLVGGFPKTGPHAPLTLRPMLVSDQNDDAADVSFAESTPSKSPSLLDRWRPVLIVGGVVLVVLVVLVIRFTWPPESTATAPAANSASQAAPGRPAQPEGPLRLYGGFGPFDSKVSGPDEVISTSLSTFYNATANPVTITNVEPIDAKGVDVVGVKYAYDGPGFESYVEGRGFPDPHALKAPGAKVLDLAEINPVAPQGHEITDQPPENAILWAIVGMKLQPGASTGSLAGIAVDYTDGTTTHRLELLGQRRLCITDGCV